MVIQYFIRLMIMRGLLINFFFSILGSCLVSACSTVADEQQAKNQWLQRNLPDREQHIKILKNTNSEYTQYILQGEIVRGMSLEETLISSNTSPYGPKLYKGRFWCDNKPVSRCASHCATCEGFILTNKEVVYFSGIKKAPEVIRTHARHTNSSMFANNSKQYIIAQALYNNEIVMGMSLAQANRVLQTLNSINSYYCNDRSITSANQCQSSCVTCKIRVSPPHETHSPANTIFLEDNYGLLTVTRIE